MFDGLLRPSAEVFTGTPHVFAKVFAASHYAATPHVMAHAFAGFLYFRAAFLHLPAGGVVILLSDAIQRQD